MSSFLTFLIESAIGKRKKKEFLAIGMKCSLTFHKTLELILHLSRRRAPAVSGTNRTRGGFWYSVIWLLLFEQGHFPEKLQIKNSIILLQRHFRKDSSVIISYIVFNSPSSFFSLKKETKMKKVEFFFFSVENTVFSQLYKSSQIWNFPVTGKLKEIK